MKHRFFNHLVKCRQFCKDQKARIAGEDVKIKVIERINEEISKQNRLRFAVLFINGRQYKVGENDIITVQNPMPLDVGDKIKLEKILMVGGQNFSLIGRPLLDTANVRVNATVIEKTTTCPELSYQFVPSKHIRKIQWLSTELTVMRINEIFVGRVDS